MDIYVSLDTFLLALIIPSVVCTCIFVTELLILWILNWRMKVGLRKIRAYRSQRATQASLEECDGLESEEEEEEEPLQPHSRERELEYEPLQLHSRERELEYASIRLPTASRQTMPDCYEEPEYATVTHQVDTSMSVEMTTNEAYILVHTGIAS